MAESEALTEPVVTAVVTTVQKAEKNPPNRTSMPGPNIGLGMNAMMRSITKSAYEAQSMGLLSFLFPSISPYTKHITVGMSNIRMISRTSDAGFGFWKG